MTFLISAKIESSLSNLVFLGFSRPPLSVELLRLDLPLSASGLHAFLVNSIPDAPDGSSIAFAVKGSEFRSYHLCPQALAAHGAVLEPKRERRGGRRVVGTVVHFVEELSGGAAGARVHQSALREPGATAASVQAMEPADSRQRNPVPGESLAQMRARALRPRLLLDLQLHHQGLAGAAAHLPGGRPAHQRPLPDRHSRRPALLLDLRAREARHLQSADPQI